MNVGTYILPVYPPCQLAYQTSDFGSRPGQTEFACLLCGGFMALIAIIKAYLQAYNDRRQRRRQQLERSRHEDNEGQQERMWLFSHIRNYLHFGTRKIHTV